MIHCKILNSIKDISPADWRRLAGDEPEGYHFFETLELSHLEDFAFYYAVIYEKDTPTLLAPLFVADFNLDIAVDEGMLKNIISGVRKLFPRFLIVKTLFCGSPFGENGFISQGTKTENSEALIKLVDTLEKFCAKKNIPLILFKDFLEKDKPLLSPLLTKKFFEVESFPNVRLELPFKSMEEYLKSLGHNTRKDIRRKIKKALAQGPVEVKIVNDVKSLIDDVYALYLNNYQSSNVRFEKLTKEFFLNISRALPNETKYFLYFIDGHLAAFNLCLASDNTLIDKFIGFDYKIARQYNLYFYTWYTNIEWCLKNNIKYYQVGQTDYQPKVQLGGKLIKMFAYLKHRNPITNALLYQLAKILAPSATDDILKTKHE